MMNPQKMDHNNCDGDEMKTFTEAVVDTRTFSSCPIYDNGNNFLLKEGLDDNFKDDEKKCLINGIGDKDNHIERDNPGYMNQPQKDDLGMFGVNNLCGQYFPYPMPWIYNPFFNPYLMNSAAMMGGCMAEFGLNYNMETFLPGMAPRTPSQHQINNTLFGNNFYDQKNFPDVNSSLLDMFSLRSQMPTIDINKNLSTMDISKSQERICTKLLTQLKEGKGNELNLDDIKDHIETFATDQYGSRFIQSKYEVAGKDEKNAVFISLLPYVHKLSQDVFGNYIIQNLFSSGNEFQKSQLLDILSENILELTLNQYGCRVLQKALEAGDADDASLIYNGIKKDFLRCMTDLHGNHVVQKIIYKISSEYHEEIVNTLEEASNFYPIISLALHQYACRVIQMMIEKFNGSNKDYIMDKLQRHWKSLFIHEFGNYVAQKAFIYGTSVDQQYILISIRDDMLRFSRNKYASNVIEVCLENGNPDQVDFLVRKVFEEAFYKLLYPMIEDQYGNYVIQKMIDKANPSLRKKLITLIKPMQNQLMKHSFYKNVLLKCSNAH
uniref:PUM-HD domain-containing protein n=1 Tax=Parastrongyloides trichosuri TaxID=131310 RepID=A0A0N4ZF31_PARTI